jgi:hypothetical protein
LKQRMTSTSIYWKTFVRNWRKQLWFSLLRCPASPRLFSPRSVRLHRKRALLFGSGRRLLNLWLSGSTTENRCLWRKKVVTPKPTIPFGWSMYQGLV